MKSNHKKVSHCEHCNGGGGQSGGAHSDGEFLFLIFCLLGGCLGGCKSFSLLNVDIDSGDEIPGIVDPVSIWCCF